MDARRFEQAGIDQDKILLPRPALVSRGAPGFASTTTTTTMTSSPQLGSLRHDVIHRPGGRRLDFSGSTSSGGDEEADGSVLSLSDHGGGGESRDVAADVALLRKRLAAASSTATDVTNAAITEVAGAGMTGFGYPQQMEQAYQHRRTVLEEEEIDDDEEVDSSSSSSSNGLRYPRGGGHAGIPGTAGLRRSPAMMQVNMPPLTMRNLDSHRRAMPQTRTQFRIDCPLRECAIDGPATSRIRDPITEIRHARKLRETARVVDRLRADEVVGDRFGLLHVSSPDSAAAIDLESGIPAGGDTAAATAATASATSSSALHIRNNTVTELLSLSTSLSSSSSSPTTTTTTSSSPSSSSSPFDLAALLHLPPNRALDVTAAVLAARLAGRQLIDEPRDLGEWARAWATPPLKRRATGGEQADTSTATGGAAASSLSMTGPTARSATEIRNALIARIYRRRRDVVCTRPVALPEALFQRPDMDDEAEIAALWQSVPASASASASTTRDGDDVGTVGGSDSAVASSSSVSLDDYSLYSILPGSKGRTSLAVPAWLGDVNGFPVTRTPTTFSGDGGDAPAVSQLPAIDVARRTSGSGEPPVFVRLRDAFYFVIDSRLRRRFPLRFRETWEADYRHKHNKATIGRWRALIAFYMLAVVAVSLTERRHLSSSPGFAIGARATMGGALLCTLLGLFTRHGHRYGRALVTLGTAIAGIGAVAITLVDGLERVPFCLLLWMGISWSLTEAPVLPLLAFCSATFVAAPILIVAYSAMPPVALVHFVFLLILIVALLVTGILRQYLSDLLARSCYVLDKEMGAHRTALNKIAALRREALMHRLPEALARDMVADSATTGLARCSKHVIVLRCAPYGSVNAVALKAIWDEFDAICKRSTAKGIHVIGEQRVDAPYQVMCESSAQNAREDIDQILIVATQMIIAVNAANAAAHFDGKAKTRIHMAVDIGEGTSMACETLSTLAFMLTGPVVRNVEKMTTYMASEDMASKPSGVACCLTAALVMQVGGDARCRQSNGGPPFVSIPAPMPTKTDHGAGALLCAFRFSSSTTALPRMGSQIDLGLQSEPTAGPRPEAPPSATTSLPSMGRMAGTFLHFKPTVERDFRLFEANTRHVTQNGVFVIAFATFLLGTMCDLALEADGKVRLLLVFLRLTVFTPLICALGVTVWRWGLRPRYKDGLTPLAYRLIGNATVLLMLAHYTIACVAIPDAPDRTPYASHMVTLLLIMAMAPMTVFVDTICFSFIFVAVTVLAPEARSEFSSSDVYTPIAAIVASCISYIVDRANRAHFLRLLWARFGIMRVSAAHRHLKRVLTSNRPLLLVDQVLPVDSTGPTPNATPNATPNTSPTRRRQPTDFGSPPATMPPRRRRPTDSTGSPPTSTSSPLLDGKQRLANTQLAFHEAYGRSDLTVDGLYLYSELSLQTTRPENCNFAVLAIRLDPEFKATTRNATTEPRELLSAMTSLLSSCELLGAAFGCTIVPTKDNKISLISRTIPNDVGLEDVMFEITECAVTIRDVAVLNAFPVSLSMLVHTGHGDPTLRDGTFDSDTMQVVYEAHDMLASIPREKLYDFESKSPMPVRRTRPLDEVVINRLVRAHSLDILGCAPSGSNETRPAIHMPVIFVSARFQSYSDNLEKLFIFGEIMSYPTVMARRKTSDAPYEHLAVETVAVVRNFVRLKSSVMFAVPTYDDLDAVVRTGDGLAKLKERLSFQISGTV